MIKMLTLHYFFRIIIKPAYAFGAEGFPMHNIPPNADIEYVITLLEFEVKIGNETIITILIMIISYSRQLMIGNWAKRNEYRRQKHLRKKALITS